MSALTKLQAEAFDLVEAIGQLEALATLMVATKLPQTTNVGVLCLRIHDDLASRAKRLQRLSLAMNHCEQPGRMH